MEEQQIKRPKPGALVTGASGMLGGYVRRLLADDFNVETLGRGDTDTIRCDLAAQSPDITSRRYELAVHCAGSEDDANSRLNSEGTRNLLDALSKNPPRYFVYVSSASVYGEEGENISEETVPSPVSESARSKEKAEREASRWAAQNDVTFTIIRPARMFGTGVGGDTLRLFNDTLNGSFIHIRGNDARVSLVTALDVARVIERVYKSGGIYNVADGHNPRFIDMAQAMTANAGREKRLTTLPASWAEWLWRTCRWIPAIDRNLNPSVVEKRLKTFTIDGSRAAAAAGIEYYNTIEVIARRDENYPYDEQ